MRRNFACTSFGKKVKIKLVEKNMTGKELAESIGMAESTICDVISGRNNRLQTRKIIAEALGMSEEDIQGEPRGGEIPPSGSLD